MLVVGVSTSRMCARFPPAVSFRFNRLDDALVGDVGHENSREMKRCGYKNEETGPKIQSGSKTAVYSMTDQAKGSARSALGHHVRKTGGRRR
jgi:hypothetical protein